MIYVLDIVFNKPHNISINIFYSTLKKYLYQHTDTYGNWTERTIISNTEDMSGRHSAQSDTIMPDSVLPSYVAPSRNQSPQVNDEIQIEKRVITYYD